MFFDISSEGLTTLKGIEFPSNVIKLDCSGNQLETLEGCPPSVTILYCYNNQLTTLKGCPSSVNIFTVIITN